MHPQCVRREVWSILLDPYPWNRHESGSSKPPGTTSRQKKSSVAVSGLSGNAKTGMENPVFNLRIKNNPRLTQKGYPTEHGWICVLI